LAIREIQANRQISAIDSLRIDPEPRTVELPQYVALASLAPMERLLTILNDTSLGLAFTIANIFSVRVQNFL
jgi:hypothetical protein